jgi:hypothetical protein
MKDFMKVIPRPVSRKASRVRINPLVAGSIEKETETLAPHTVIYRMKVDLGAQVAIANHAMGTRFAAEQVCEMVCHYLYKDIYEKALELKLAIMECESDAVLHEKVCELMDMCR